MHKFDITYEDAEPTLETIEFAVQSGNITRALKEQLGAARMLKSFEDAAGAQVYVLDYEHIARIHIVPPGQAAEPPEAPLPEDEHTDEVGVIDYVSGAVLGPVIRQEPLSLPGDDPEKAPPARPLISNLRITERTAERIPADFARHKLAVVEDGAFAPVRGDDPKIYSQHASIKPGLYSGAMRPLVQVLLGVGLAHPYTYESRWINQNKKRFLTNEDFLEEPELMPKSGFGLFHATNPIQEVKVLYDYRWNRTHGVAWGEDGKAYIVEIGQRGVLVMPLPVDPISTTAAGRKRYEQLFPELFDAGAFPQNGKHFFDLFGGFPLGTPMPRGPNQVDEWKRAGEVFEALSAEQMAEVYKKQTYSTAMGWCFSPDGTQAHNTCYGYREDGLKIGHHYAVTIKIGAHEPRTPAKNAGEMIARLGLQGVEKRKALRMEERQVAGILAIEDIEAAREALKSETVQADFRAVANLRQQKKGPLYNPGGLIPKGTATGWSGQPQIKFPEPLLGQGTVLSFDFGADEVAPEDAPRCDTPMFVFFESGGLQTVNYFWEYRPPGTSKVVNTKQPCQVTGGWTVGTYSDGDGVLNGNFYTTHVDWREMMHGSHHNEINASQSITKVLASFGFCTFSDMIGYAQWNYFGSNGTDQKVSGGKSRKISVVVPSGDRSIYLIAKFDTEHDTYTRQTSNSVSLGTGSSIAFGIVQRGFTAICGPNGWSDEGEITCVMRPYADEVLNNPDACIQDSISVGDTPYSLCNGQESGGGYYGDLPPSHGWSVSTPVTNIVGCEIRIYGDTHNSGAKTIKKELSGDDPLGQGGKVDFYSLYVSDWWHRPSPDENGNLATMTVNVNDFGAALVGYEPDFNALNAEYAGEPASMHVYLGACFVGWVA